MFKSLLSLVLALALVCALAIAPAVAEEAVVYTFEGAYVSTVSDVKFPFSMQLNADGTVLCTPGVKIYDIDDYDESATGTWSEADGVITISLSSEDGSLQKDYELVLENGGYSFPMSVSLSGYIRPIQMNCTTEGFIPVTEEEAEEAAAEEETEAEEEPAAAETDENVVTVFAYSNGTGSMTGAITLYEDNTAKAEYVMASMNYTLLTLNGTWQAEGEEYAITLEGDDNNEETALTSVDGVITWALHFVGGGNVNDATIELTNK